MPSSYRSLWPLMIGTLFLMYAFHFSQAAELQYSGRLSPSDYLFGSQEQHGDAIFDNAKPIEI